MKMKAVIVVLAIVVFISLFFGVFFLKKRSPSLWVHKQSGGLISCIKDDVRRKYLATWVENLPNYLPSEARLVKKLDYYDVFIEEPFNWSVFNLDEVSSMRITGVVSRDGKVRLVIFSGGRFGLIVTKTGGYDKFESSIIYRDGDMAVYEQE